MKTNRLTVYASVMFGLLYFSIGVTLFWDPSFGNALGSLDFFKGVVEEPIWTHVRHLLYGLTGVLGFAIVPGWSEAILKNMPKDWVAFFEKLVYISFLVTILDSFKLSMLIPDRADIFMSSSAVQKSILASTENLTRIDPNAWMRFGFVIPWLSMVGIALYKSSSAYEKKLGILALFTSLMVFLSVLGITFKQMLLIKITLLIGGQIALPILFILVGLCIKDDCKEL